MVDGVVVVVAAAAAAADSVGRELKRWLPSLLLVDGRKSEQKMTQPSSRNKMPPRRSSRYAVFLLEEEEKHVGQRPSTDCLNKNLRVGGKTI